MQLRHNRDVHTRQSLVGSRHGQAETVVTSMRVVLQVTQLFKDHGIQHAPRYLFNDVAQAIQHVHLSGKMHERCGMPRTQQAYASLKHSGLRAKEGLLMPPFECDHDAWSIK
jgi:hypothetical protein